MRRRIPLIFTIVFLAVGYTAAQNPQAPPANTAPQKLGTPTPIPGSAELATSSVATANPWPTGATPAPVSLAVALRLAQINNLDIAQARQGVNVARADVERARVAFLPNLNFGTTYSEHQGQIAKTEGNIITVNKDALFVGGGPSMNIALVEAIYGPPAARAVERSTSAGLRRVTNDTLFSVADTYFNLLRARRRLARVEEVIDYLTADRVTPQGSRFLGVLPLVQAHVQAGGREASLADLERVRVEILRREEERPGAVADYRVAAAELGRLLRLDPTTALWPIEDFRYPMPMPGGEYATQPIEQLVGIALNNRPEVRENQALVRAAVERVRMAKARPYVPNLVLNYNWGGFGGAPDPNPSIVTPPKTPGGKPTVTAQPGFGPSGEILHFGTRQDLDVSLVWRLQNLGLGNRAEIHDQQARQMQAALRDAQGHDRIVTQVIQSLELVTAWRERVKITQAALFDEQGRPNGPVFKALRLDFDRIRGAEGRPLELLDSVRRLSDLLDSYGQAATEYERARFRLLIALGIPIETQFDAAADASRLCPPAEFGGSPPPPVK